MLVHAAGESYGLPCRYECDCRRIEFRDGPDPDIIKVYDKECPVCQGAGFYRPVVYAIALAAPSELALEQLAAELDDAGLRHRCVKEPDSPWDGALMAIGICPTPDKKLLRRFTGKLPLLGQEK